jgi:peptidoglycan/xylan/chitin deacetylase (PgdA/CDA1 family)
MLKRFLVLAFAVVLFVTAFFIYFHVVDARIEGQFRAEREKFHVDNANLVSTTPPGPEPLTPTPPPLPVVSTPSAPDAGSAVPTPPAPSGIHAPTAVPLDSNTLIGPVPPASGDTPPAPMDTNAPGNPAPPSTNATPDSTLIYPVLRRLPLLMAATDTEGVRAPDASTDNAPAAPAAPAAAPATATNASTATNAEAPTVAAPAAPAQKAAPVAENPAARTTASSVIVLGYHQFSPPGVRVGGKFIYTMPQDVFEYEMKYLYDNHYNVVPLSDVVAFAKRQKVLPPNTVAITIDDGYKSPLVFAEPILKKYNFPWTFFCYPQFIGNHPATNYRGAASWPELVELDKEGVDIECHSMTHPLLTRHGSKTPEEYDAWLTNEVVTSKAVIEQHLGHPIKYFAYPFGDYNKAVEAKTIGAGYEAIFTVANNPIHPGTNVYAMGRYIITTPVEKAYVSYLRQGALGLADISPVPGATVTDPRPVISAVLGYAGTIDPKSIVAEVRDMGEVRFDFDPKTLALRLYLPRDLIDSVVVINVHAKDATTGQTMMASWRFNYQSAATGATHPPIAANATNAPTTEPATATNVPPPTPARAHATALETNAPAPTVRLNLSAPIPTTDTTNITPDAGTNAAPAVGSNAVPATPATPATP